MNTVKDLTIEAPRSPREKIGNYVILGRMLDKGRALLEGKCGEYHFDCPLDNMLLGFKGVKGSEIKELLESGKSDENILTWLNENGESKTTEEIQVWSSQLENFCPYEIPEKKEWFIGACSAAGIDPAKSTLFDMLEADDKVTFKK